MVISVITDYQPEPVERLRTAMNGLARLQNTVCHLSHQEHRYLVDHARLNEALERVRLLGLKGR
jgi:hypothetical protein